MESQSITQESPSDVAGAGKSGLGNVYCKCGDGWKCVLTRNQGPDAGKSFECGENCSCTIDGDVMSKDLNLPFDVVSNSGSEAFCKCGEGWSCVISRIETPEPGTPKGFECAGSCTCAVTDAK